MSGHERVNDRVGKPKLPRRQFTSRRLLLLVAYVGGACAAARLLVLGDPDLRTLPATAILIFVWSALGALSGRSAFRGLALVLFVFLFLLVVLMCLPAIQS